MKTPSKVDRGEAPKAKRALPAALERNAQALRKASVARHRARGLEALTTVRERRRDITQGFLEVGDALRVLREERVVEALGRASFAELCEKDLDMSLTKALQLVQLAERIDRPLALELGQERGAALLELADAAPDGGTPEALARGKLRLPSGRTLDVERASSRQIREAAAAIRRARGARGRGRTTSVEEQAAFDALCARIAEAPALARAKLKLVAMGAKRGADVTIRVPLSELVALAKALGRRR